MPPESIEQKSPASKNRRSLKLMVHFVNGYSVDYCFVLPENFKPALDIKQTYRVIKKPIADPPGFIKKKESFYTQGKYYSFDNGDTLYDSADAYGDDWSVAIKKIKYSIQIKDASPAFRELTEITLEGKKKYHYNPGRVEFTLYKPDKNFTRLVEHKTYECTQENFVALLQYGTLKTLDNKTIKIL